MGNTIPNVSVVVLAYKSGDTIVSFVEHLIVSLEQVEPNWEIVIVGNYFKNTGDKTPQVVQMLAEKYPRVHAVTKVKEGMMGWDMKTGLDATTGKTLAVIDGDNQMPFEDVARVYQRLMEEGLDLVKTYRIRREDGPYRNFLSAVYNLIFKAMFPGLKSRDINSKPKIMSRAAYECLNLVSDGWFIDAEIMIQARRLNLRVGEIGTRFMRLSSRPSFVKPVTVIEFIANLVWARILEFKYCFKKKDGPVSRD